MESIEIELHHLVVSGYDAAASANVRVELWSSNSNGTPNARLAELEVPTTLPRGPQAFKAPAGTELAASTSYHVVIYTVSGEPFDIRATRIDDEDPGAGGGLEHRQRLELPSTRGTPTTGGARTGRRREARTPPRSR